MKDQGASRNLRIINNTNFSTFCFMIQLQKRSNQIVYSPPSISSSAGIELSRWLLDKSNTSTTAMSPMVRGIVPVSLLPARFNIFRDWNLQISSGIDPVKPFLSLIRQVQFLETQNRVCKIRKLPRESVGCHFELT